MAERDPTIATTPAPGRSWVGVVVLLVAVAATFANAVDNQFVYDDQVLIVDDPAVRLPLSAGVNGLQYRPLRTFSYRIDYALGGLDPRIYHLNNVVYHAATVVLAFTLLGMLGAGRTGALLGALVFAVHPVQADAVTYAAGRRDILCGLFYLLGMVAYLRHRRDGGRAVLALAFVAYVLAIMAKEMAVTLPLACLIVDRWCVRRGHDGRDARAVRPRQLGAIGMLGTIGACGLGVLALGVTYGGHIYDMATERPWHGGSVGTNLATVARVWVKYLQLVVWPSALSVDYSYDAFPVSLSALEPRGLASGVLLAGLAFCGWASWRRGGRAGLGLAWMAVTLLPVSHLVPFRELLAEHYLYIPMMGVAMIVSDVADRVRCRWPAQRRWLAAAGCVIVGALMARTIVRNGDWQDQLTLWSATVAVVPQCARAQFNLGQAYFERSRFMDAERAWLAAVALQPDDRATQRALATLDQRLGRYDLADAKIAALLASDPDDPETLVLAGGVALDRGRPERAREYFDAALVTLPPERAERARRGREHAARAAVRRVRPTTASPDDVR